MRLPANKRDLLNIVAGVLLLAACLLASPVQAWAGPPFLTDDPQPIDYRHWESYLFTTQDVTSSGNAVNLPAIETNYGPAPNLHLHIVVPYAQNIANGAPHTSGLGDIELGVKYRFVQETAGRPMIGIFPMAEVATGNAAQGLGNGVTWYKLPLWIQKSYGPWTTYGGGGWAINSAPGMANYPFGGWLVQRDIGSKLTLGGELFSEGPTIVGGQHATFYNVGGYLKPTDNFNILFSVGHTISGENHAIGYFALYWTWGPKGKE
jgi:hypothetical protein